jgi:hypothetical protein
MRLTHRNAWRILNEQRIPPLADAANPHRFALFCYPLCAACASQFGFELSAWSIEWVVDGKQAKKTSLSVA